MNSTIVRCDACLGRKMIMGMGAMRIKCKNCNGIGSVDSTAKEHLKSALAENIQKSDLKTEFPSEEAEFSVLSYKKRGPKKKIEMVAI